MMDADDVVGDCFDWCGGGVLRGRRMIWWQAREKSWY